MPAGRPTAYNPSYCEDVIDLGKAGKSLAQMAAHFDVSRQTIDNWGMSNPIFLEALSRAKAHCQAWWEDKAQIGMEMPGFNAAVWKKSVEARFRDDYTERREISGPDGSPLKLEHSGALAELSSHERAAIRQMVERRIKPPVEAEPDEG